MPPAPKPMKMRILRGEGPGFSVMLPGQDIVCCALAGMEIPSVLPILCATPLQATVEKRAPFLWGKPQCACELDSPTSFPHPHPEL